MVLEMSRLKNRRGAMRLGDVYINKNCAEVIQIDSFATRINSFLNLEVDDDMVIVVRHLTESCGVVGFAPSFNSYGTKEEIEALYELFIPQEQLKNYKTLKEVLTIAQEKKGSQGGEEDENMGPDLCI